MIVQSKFIHKIINWTPIKKLLITNRLFVRAYFNYLYQQSDPYHVVQKEEINKFKRAFCLLGGFKAKKALEIGCGEGRLSHYIAAISEKVVAFDISDIAIKKAKEINRDNSKIEYRRRDLIAEDFLEDKYDFIFCSEILYYLELSQLDDVIPRIINILNPNGKLLLVHIRSLKDDSSGLELKEFGAKTIHKLFIQNQQLELEEDLINVNYRITLLHRK